MQKDVFGIVGSLQAAVFRVERVVAEGGFGVVYRAYHEGFQAAVALKCLKIPLAFSSEQRQQFLLKFQEEGQVLFRLSALIPSVVRPLHVGTLESASHPFVPFIALEWLDGLSLDAVIERRRSAGKPPLDLARVARVMGPVARALECAHKFPGASGAELSILHRDLKPENLFLASVHGREVLKILDFGIGKVRSVATQMVGKVSAEQGGIAAFTPAYGAPEQWLPKRYGQTGPWTDVWGLALCMVEALTNEPPFEGDVAEVMAACIDEAVRPTPLSAGVKLPPRAEAALRKALAVDPIARYQDIGAFWDEIEAASGVTTPRITDASTSSVLSLPPPPESAGPASSLLARQQVDEPGQARAELLPRLTLGLAPPSQRREAQGSGPKPYQRSQGATFEPEDDALRISVLDERMRLPAPAARAEVMRARGPSVARAVRVRAPSEAPTLDTAISRMKPALRVIGLGLAIMVADLVYALHYGESLRVGPARALWLAGPLVGFGLVKLLVALAR